jgi:hypothetical protein
MEDLGLLYISPFGILYGHLPYFMAILFYIFRLFGTYYGPFWYVVVSEIWQPCNVKHISVAADLMTC